MNYKEEYIAFCNQQDWIPLFHQPYWWDTVTSKWDVTKLTSKDAIAYLPYALEKKFAFTFSRNPHLTPYSGLLFASATYSEAQQEKLFSLSREFIKQFSLGIYDCNPLLVKALENENKKTTYLLNLDKPKEAIHQNFKSSLKRQLKKAEKNLHIVPSQNIDLFYEVYTDSLKRQKGSSIVPKETIRRALDLCHKKEIGTLFMAKDEADNIHAAIFNVHDARCSYYLLGGSRTEFMGSGAMGFLLWHCIQNAKTADKQYFDFEGSEVTGVARFFSTFGGQRVQYPTIETKTNPSLRILLSIKNKLGL